MWENTMSEEEKKEASDAAKGMFDNEAFVGYMGPTRQIAELQSASLSDKIVALDPMLALAADRQMHERLDRQREDAKAAYELHSGNLDIEAGTLSLNPTLCHHAPRATRAR
jgi:hypothetical protein